MFTCISTCMFTCRFKEVFYTDDHLAIVMEYASEGHLSNRIKLNGRLAEDDARRHVPNAHHLDGHILALSLQNILLWPSATRAACWMLLLHCSCSLWQRDSVSALGMLTCYGHRPDKDWLSLAVFAFLSGAHCISAGCLLRCGHRHCRLDMPWSMCSACVCSSMIYADVSTAVGSMVCISVICDYICALWSPGFVLWLLWSVQAFCCPRRTSSLAPILQILPAAG